MRKFFSLFFTFILVFNTLSCATMKGLGKDICVAVLGNSKAGKICEEIKVPDEEAVVEEEAVSEVE